MKLQWKIAYALVTMLATSLIASAKELIWCETHTPVHFSILTDTDPVVHTALDMFAEDIKMVTGQTICNVDKQKGMIQIIQLDKANNDCIKKIKAAGIQVETLMDLTDGFNISVHHGKIYITGVNGRGTAYGILELSRMAGVSPWVWWGDVIPEKQNELTIDSKFCTTQGASVEYRGVFLNDEDWSLRPWSYGTYEPAQFGQIGPRTYKRIFEFLLRMRANAIWPGMHTGTKAFFLNPANKTIADSCGIVIGTSHCEPLLRNNVDEWDESKRGMFNYRINRDEIHKYWGERLDEVKNSKGGNMFTIGMRGIHDGPMDGYKTIQEKTEGLQQVIYDQQELIRQHIGDPSQQMQVFVPYKEVLEIYQRGLKVPDYVTLMWCDDNYGYMTRLSTPKEQKRSGGGGVYYHLSYWGRPHDYLWLTTTQPGLIYNEMRAAYDHNVRKLWIVNVHDIKVAGYDLELFLDMAWNINAFSSENIEQHYKAWLTRQFGNDAADLIYPSMLEFYKLCGERKPEFMGWSQTELDKRLYLRGLSPVTNTEFSNTEFGNELDRYIERYNRISDVINMGKEKIRPELQDAYFAAIQYPVNVAAANATKMLEAQKARQFASGSTLGDMFINNAAIYTSVAKSQAAYQRIRTLTAFYNDTMADGKWKRSMNMRPRDLPAMAAPSLPTLLNDKEISEWLGKAKQGITYPLDTDGTIARNACEYDEATGSVKHVSMLGHSMKAVALPKGAKIIYQFNVPNTGEALLRTALIPTQPHDNGDIRYSVTIDDNNPIIVSIKEPFRSEQWKKNVLRGQCINELPVNLTAGQHKIEIEAIDDHIVVDQWMIDFKKDRKFYLFPIVSK